MQAYRRVKALVAVVLCGYAVAAVVLKASLRHEAEVFPVFAWSVFTTVPAENAEYALRILAVAGDALDPPRFYEEVPSFFPESQRVEVFWIAQRLGRALDSGDVERIRAHRLLLERQHLRGRGTLQYEIVHRTFNTLARWSTGQFKSIRPLATFSTERTAQ